MTDQYLRSYRLTVGGLAGGMRIEGDGREDRSLRITFEVQHAEKSFPQNAVISIFNANEQSQQKFLQKEFQQIELFGGYGGNTGIVFKGEIIQARRIRTEAIVDTAVVLTCRDSDKAMSFGFINKALAEGHTSKDRIEACLSAWKENGITAGFIDKLPETKFPRPRVLLGKITDRLDEICETAGAAWHVRGGQLYVVKRDGTVAGDTVVLNSGTGMVGRAEQTIDGVVVKCLLNPKIRPGVKVKIDERSINLAPFSPAYLGERNNALLPSIATDGIYKVLYVDEVGDTRGQPWYTIATCISASGGIIPLTLAPRGIGLGAP